jgi:hypothetical protein
MFTMLSGRHVHDAKTSQEQMILSATTPAVSLANVAPGLPRAVVSIVDRALAFDRTKRWPNASSMGEAVRAALDALGGRESLGAPGRPSTGTLVSREGGAQARAATMLDTTATGSSAAAWTVEREGRLAEVAKLRARVSELSELQVPAKRDVADAQAKVDAGRQERKSLEQWFKRQVGTRTAAVEEARKEARRQMVALARRAMDDRAVFGPEFDSTREQIAKLDRAAESAARDVEVHGAAIEAYDPPSLRKGVLLLGVLAVIALALLIAPIVWRATRVVAPE